MLRRSRPGCGSDAAAAASAAAAAAATTGGGGGGISSFPQRPRPDPRLHRLIAAAIGDRLFAGRSGGEPEGAGAQPVKEFGRSGGDGAVVEERERERKQSNEENAFLSRARTATSLPLRSKYHDLSPTHPAPRSPLPAVKVRKMALPPCVALRPGQPNPFPKFARTIPRSSPSRSRRGGFRRPEPGV